jgi:hypothetical protein
MLNLLSIYLQRCMILNVPVSHTIISWFHLVTLFFLKAEVQKVLCQLLSHLHIMPGLEHRAILKLNVLLNYHDEVEMQNINRSEF